MIPSAWSSFRTAAVSAFTSARLMRSSTGHGHKGLYHLPERTGLPSGHTVIEQSHSVGFPQRRHGSVRVASGNSIWQSHSPGLFAVSFDERKRRLVIIVDHGASRVQSVPFVRQGREQWVFADARSIGPWR